MVKIEFYVVFNRGGPQLPDAFYRIKEYCSYPKLSHFGILKIQVITVHVRTSIAISQKYWILEMIGVKYQTFQNIILALKGNLKFKRPISKF